MRRSLTLLGIVCGLALALAGPAVAQFANADLGGTVTDSDGAPLPGVTVTATNQDTGASRTTASSANGSYAINGLRPGPYDVGFTLDGFQTIEQTGVQLRVGQEGRLNAEMQIGTVEETITVTSVAPIVEVTSKEIGGTLTAAEFEQLPTQNRSALLFASLMPGVIPDTSTESTASDALFINGQDDNNNNFNIDGANNDDDVIGARAGAQARTPMEAIQEFQVLTSQFDAEFGRSLGGVLNAVTKSGGNAFSGSVFWFMQDASLNETDFILEQAGVPEPDTSYESIGFTLGGPIVTDKLHFFVSYEDNSNEEGQGGFFANRPDLNFSTTENNAIENSLAKLDYQPADNHHLAVRYLLEESPQFNQIIGDITLEAAREEDDTDSNWTFSVESVVSDRIFNTGRFAFTKEDVSFANPGFNNNGQDFASQRNQTPEENHPDFRSGASTVAQSRVNRATQLSDTLSIYVPEWNGEHEFRIGFQYSEREETFTNFGNLNGSFFGFDTDAPFDPDDISTYPDDFSIRVLGGLTSDIPQNDVIGLFAQDNWRVTDALTLNLGVRFDDENITDDTNIAPRLGFSWDPFGQGRTVVRGGYGRFYDRFQLGFFSNFFLDAVDLTQGFTLPFPDGDPDAQLFFDIVQANGITTLVQLRDFLAAQLEGTAVAPINSAPTVDNPDRVQPYLDQFSIGIEHEFRPGWSAGADVIHNQNRDILLAVNLNPTSTAAGGTRPNISILNGAQTDMSSITTWVNAAETDFTALQLSLQKRFDGRFGGRISYTYGDSDGNTDGGGGGTDGAYFQTRTESGYNFDTGQIIGEALNLNLGDARNSGIPVNWHREHNLVLSGNYLVPSTSWRDSDGLVVSWIYRFMSGTAITLLDNSARLDNSNRVPLAAGDFQGSGQNSQSVSNNGKLRGADNPDFTRLDLSLRYNIPFASDMRVQLLADIFNVFDEVNWEDVGGTRNGLGSFLNADDSLNPREFQLGIRFEF